MIDKYVNQFLNSKFNPQMKAPKEDTVVIHMSLPYIEKPSLLLARKVRTLCKNHFHVTLQCTFVSTKMSFHLKMPDSNSPEIKCCVSLHMFMRCELFLHRKNQTTLDYLGNGASGR